MNNTLSLIILLGAIQGGILSITLFFSKHNRTANKALSLSIFFVSIALLLAWCHLTLDYYTFTFQIKATLPLPLLFIPLIYLYSKINTKQNQSFKAKDSLYFIPFLIIFFYNLPFYLGSSVQKIAYFERENIEHSAWITDQLEIILVNIVVFIFAIAILRLVFKMRQNFEEEVSNYRETIIKLMFFLAWATLIFTFIGLSLSILQVAKIEYPGFFDFLTAIGSTLLIYFIGYYTLFHPQIFHPLEENTGAASPKPLPQKKENNHDEYLAKILQAMKNGKHYQDPSLSLQSFSHSIHIPAYLVSKIINSRMNLNFYNFVNKYRIEEVKQELLDCESPQILQIAFSAGFNTKSSFYNYFKKHTGFSPKEFIKQSDLGK